MGSFWKNIHPLLRRTFNQTPSDTNYAILNAIDSVLGEAETETINAKIQSSLKTATGEYLDEYGDWFGVFRRDKDEDDETYRKRIIQAVNIPRGTNESIKWGIRDFFRDHTIGIEVYEPWTDVFYLNRLDSRLNGDHHLLGYYYNFAVIDVKIGKPFPESIRSVIRDFKPAGVRLHLTYDPSLAPNSEDDSELTVKYVRYNPMSIIGTMEFIQGLDTRVSGDMYLSDVKALNKILHVNREQEKTNSDYVLTGSYSVHNDRLHLLAQHGDYTPNQDTHIGTVNRDLESVDSEDYLKLNETDNEFNTYKIRPNQYVYFVLNADTHFRLTHDNVKQVHENYEKLISDSSINLTYKSNIQGSIIELQAYNFIKREWETLNRSLTETTFRKFHSALGDGKSFLNDNNLVLLRVASNRAIELHLDHFSVNYSQVFQTDTFPKLFTLSASSERMIEEV